MTTRPGVSAAELFGAIRRASALLSDIVAVLEPALEQAAAVSAGQLMLLERAGSAAEREVVEKTAAWAREALAPLEHLLAVASAPPYRVAQDDLQKRMLRDLQEEATRLREQVVALKRLLTQSPPRSQN